MIHAMCIDKDNCSFAKLEEVQELADDAALVCSLCGKSAVPVPPPSGPVRPLKRVGILAACLLVLFSIGYMVGSTLWHPGTVTQKPTAAAVVTDDQRAKTFVRNLAGEVLN